MTADGGLGFFIVNTTHLLHNEHLIEAWSPRDEGQFQYEDYPAQAAITEFKETGNAADAFAKQQELEAVKAAAIMADASTGDNALSKSFTMALVAQKFVEEMAEGKSPNLKKRLTELDLDRIQRWYNRTVSGLRSADAGTPALMADATAKFYNEGKLPGMLQWWAESFLMRDGGGEGTLKDFIDEHREELLNGY